MADEIQLVTVGSGTVVATDTAIHNGEDEGGKHNLLSGCQDWTVDQYKVDYLTSLEAR